MDGTPGVGGKAAAPEHRYLSEVVPDFMSWNHIPNPELFPVSIYPTTPPI